MWITGLVEVVKTEDSKSDSPFGAVPNTFEAHKSRSPPSWNFKLARPGEKRVNVRNPDASGYFRLSAAWGGCPGRKFAERKRDQKDLGNHHPAWNFPASYFGPASLYNTCYQISVDMLATG
jgi:hypothetical protein